MVHLFIDHLCFLGWTISFGKLEWKFSLNPLIVVFDRPMTVVDGMPVVKPFDKLTDVENKRVQYDCVAKNIITSALNLEKK